MPFALEIESQYHIHTTHTANTQPTHSQHTANAYILRLSLIIITIYLYNTVRGQLQNIPAIGAGAIYESLYSGSSDNSSAAASALQLVSDLLSKIHSENDKFLDSDHVEVLRYFPEDS